MQTYGTKKNGKSGRAALACIFNNALQTKRNPTPLRETWAARNCCCLFFLVSNNRTSTRPRETSSSLSARLRWQWCINACLRVSHSSRKWVFHPSCAEKFKYFVILFWQNFLHNHYDPNFSRKHLNASEWYLNCVKCHVASQEVRLLGLWPATHLATSNINLPP